MKKVRAIRIIMAMILLMMVLTPSALAASATKPSITVEFNEEKLHIGETNAILAFNCTLSGASAADVTKVRVAVYDATNNSVVCYREDSVTFGKFNDFEVWYDVNTELDYVLTPDVPYCVHIKVFIGEDAYWSNPLYFRTNGSHEHMPGYQHTLKEATCSEEGLLEYYCYICGSKLQESIPKLPHTYDKGFVNKAATCKEEGIKTYTCTICRSTMTENLEKLPHTLGEGIITEEATCGKTGLITYSCTVCNETETEEIPMLSEHSYTDGTCTVCGGSDPNYVPPTVPDDPTGPEEPTEPSDPTEPVEPGEDKEEGGFFAAIAAFFEAIFRVLFFFLYL